VTITTLIIGAGVNDASRSFTRGIVYSDQVMNERGMDTLSWQTGRWASASWSEGFWMSYKL
jgi:hypothetical protein